MSFRLTEPVSIKRALSVKHKKRMWKNMVTASQYSGEAFRDEVRHFNVKPVIPYLRNQRKEGKILRARCTGNDSG
jgi:hypothetical protein